MRKKKILIVDDEPESIEMFKTRLELSGYEVISITSGLEALELIQTVKPDLVLLDIILPDANGFDICRAIKSKENTKNIKVIACTNKLDEIDAIDARESYADEFIEKMSDSKILLNTVKRLI